MTITQHTPLVLASGSAIRAQMLKSVGVQFSVSPSGADEDAIKAEMANASAEELGLALARAKGKALAARYPDAITLSADQLCVLDLEGGERVIFDKPGTIANATAQLNQLSGQWHTQYSAAVLYRGDTEIFAYVGVLSEEEIVAYLRADDPLASCGAYQFESLGRHLFDEVQGDPDTIKGLPLIAILAKLHEMGAISL
jgi:septum formation protein